MKMQILLKILKLHFIFDSLKIIIKQKYTTNSINCVDVFKIFKM